VIFEFIAHLRGCQPTWIARQPGFELLAEENASQFWIDWSDERERGIAHRDSLERLSAAQQFGLISQICSIEISSTLIVGEKLLGLGVISCGTCSICGSKPG